MDIYDIITYIFATIIIILLIIGGFYMAKTRYELNIESSCAYLEKQYEGLVNNRERELWEKRKSYEAKLKALLDEEKRLNQS